MERVAPPRRGVLRELGLAWACALVLRAVAAGRAESLWPDGVIELEQARAFAAGRWGEGLAWGFHPLYSLLVAALHALGAPLEGAARGVAVVLSAGVAPACGAAAVALLPEAHERPARARQVALAAGVLAAALPLLVRLGGQVLAYGPAHLALALALLGALRAAGEGRRAPAWSLLAGAGVGLGYLCRSDALATGAGLGLAVAGARGPAGARATRLLGLALGLLLTALPYPVALHALTGEWRLSLKKEAGLLLRTPTPGAPVVPDPAAPLELWQLVRQEEVGPEPVALAPVPGYPLLDSAWFAARKLLGAAHPLLALLALAGLGLPLARSPTWPACVPLLGLLGGWVGQTLLRANYGYTDRIHAAFAGVLLAPLAGLGLVLLAGALARRLRTPSAPLRGALLAVCLAALVPAALEPQRQGRGRERLLGALLRARAGEGELTVCGRDTRVLAWHAGARYLDLPPGPPAKALEAARQAGARFLVVHIRWRGGRPGELERALLGLGLAPALHDEDAREEVRYAWLAWDLGHLGAPETPSRR